MKNVEKITTVSSFLQKQIEKNLTGKRFEIIANGYDPQITKAVEEIEQRSDVFSIAFAGTIYGWHPIESFLNVLNEIVREDSHSNIQFHCYGVSREKELREWLDTEYSQLQPHVFLYDRKSNLELAQALAQSNVCLLFNDYSILGTKIFDYLAVKRKILLCYENDPAALELKKQFYNVDDIASESTQLQAEMIAATNSGVVARDAQHLKWILHDLIRQHQEKGFIPCSSINVEEHSRLGRVERLAQVIKEVARVEK